MYTYLSDMKACLHKNLGHIGSAYFQQPKWMSNLNVYPLMNNHVALRVPYDETPFINLKTTVCVNTGYSINEL